MRPLSRSITRLQVASQFRCPEHSYRATLKRLKDALGKLRIKALTVFLYRHLLIKSFLHGLNADARHLLPAILQGVPD
jgi:hypothetical protein